MALSTELQDFCLPLQIFPAISGDDFHVLSNRDSQIHLWERFINFHCQEVTPGDATAVNGTLAGTYFRFSV